MISVLCDKVSNYLMPYYKAESFLHKNKQIAQTLHLKFNSNCLVCYIFCFPRSGNCPCWICRCCFKK